MIWDMKFLLYIKFAYLFLSSITYLLHIGKHNNNNNKIIIHLLDVEMSGYRGVCLWRWCVRLFLYLFLRRIQYCSYLFKEKMQLFFYYIFNLNVCLILRSNRYDILYVYLFIYLWMNIVYLANLFSLYLIKREKLLLIFITVIRFSYFCYYLYLNYKKKSIFKCYPHTQELIIQRSLSFEFTL